MINTLKGKLFGLILLFLIIYNPFSVWAAEGDCGYEGGISSGVAVDKKYDYKEIIFVTGKPIVVQGDLTVKKTIKDTAETWTYIYSNLKNTDEKVVASRTVVYNVAVNKKDAGQVQKQVSIKGTPIESIKIDKVTYTLKKYSFSKSTIVDEKPLAQYFAGEFMGEKTYNVSAGTGTSSGTVKVTTKGEVYGYNQYWSGTEAQNIEYVVQGAAGGLNWSGTVNMGVSMTTSKKISYESNKPEAISFEGGYVQTQNNVSLLQYSSEFPEFDSKGKPTDYIVKAQDTLKFDTFPQITRLVAPVLRKIKGHWAENDIKLAYALEIFKEDTSDFKPNDYMTRREFARVMVMAGRLMTDEEIASAQAVFDPAGNTAAKKKTTGKKNQLVQVFNDVPIDYPYYPYIMKAYEKEIIDGVSEMSFGPQSAITRAEAVALIVRALGLEDRAPGPVAVTSFKDNDSIPSWARSSAYIAEKLGIIKGDSFGNFNPGKNMTKGEVAVMIIRFIDYMRQDIIKDYRDNAVMY
ncbi:MAG: S-layer homology domain-containing protein [Deltaproteobacteria bacterium]